MRRLEGTAYIVLDSSIYNKEFTRETKELLEEKDIFVSSTFRREINAYQAYLKTICVNSHDENLSKNYHYVSELAARGRLFEYQSDDYPPLDIWELIILLCGEKIPICVVTSDKLLINRLKCFLLPNDCLDSDLLIWDLNMNRLLTHDQKAANDYTVIMSESGSYSTAHIGTGSVLFKGDNSTITLGNPVNGSVSESAGAEGTVFLVAGSPDLVVKIYRQAPCQKTVSHLRMLSRMKTSTPSWCLMPCDIVYEGDRAVGFTMKRVKAEMLEDDELYDDRDELEISRDTRKKPISYIIRHCLMLLTQIKYLNSIWGINITDFNMKNHSRFTIDQPIVFFDADSFCHERYFHGYIDDKRFSVQYDHRYLEDLTRMAYESALKTVFKLLSLGYAPFRIDVKNPGNYRFVFSDSNTNFGYRKLYFPRRVLMRLSGIFEGNRIPSLNLLIDELTQVKEYLKKHPMEDITIGEMIDMALTHVGEDPPIKSLDDVPRAPVNRTPNSTQRTTGSTPAAASQQNRPVSAAVTVNNSSTSAPPVQSKPASAAAQPQRQQTAPVRTQQPAAPAAKSSQAAAPNTVRRTAAPAAQSKQPAASSAVKSSQTAAARKGSSDAVAVTPDAAAKKTDSKKVKHPFLLFLTVLLIMTFSLYLMSKQGVIRVDFIDKYIVPFYDAVLDFFKRMYNAFANLFK